MTHDDVWVGIVSYGAEERRWLQQTDHYLGNAPPGCLFAVGVRLMASSLFADMPAPSGGLVGLCLVSRPIARMLPQDGSVGEITRLWLQEGLPYGLASRVLTEAARIASNRGMSKLISYHDRTRHSGCIYRKAGFRKAGVVNGSATGWASRKRSESARASSGVPKRRWELTLAEATR